ncbi:MAG: hypothetical protein K2J90_10060 [Lachnospiraceae bacterium]|nr:hypothetical protein [Lachnospiraceae bacterium]
MNKKKHKSLLIYGFPVIVLAGILLPGILLHIIFSMDLGKTLPAPRDYYIASNSVISRNASSKLTEYEKMKLISGVWESTETPVDSSQSGITETDAVELAKKAVDELYEDMLYPYHFDSSYGNWYSWDAELYQCTESTFHTYTAYYWMIHFYKYDDTETHKILMTENGTLLCISVNRPNLKPHPNDNNQETANSSFSSYADSKNFTRNTREHFRKKYKKGTTPVSFLRVPTSQNLPSYKNMPIESPSYYFAETMLVGVRVLNWDDYNKIADSTENIEKYYIYQCNTKANFTIAIIPWE